MVPLDPAEPPTAAQLIHFLSVFETLSAFEAQQRYVRGWGAFGPDEALPDPDVIAVLAWLRHAALQGSANAQG